MRFEKATEGIAQQQYDWKAHSVRMGYTPEQIRDVGRWQQTMSKEDAEVAACESVDVERLNSGQRIVYDAVVKHNARQRAGPTQPLHAMICGTAGSGKTFLIKALKQALGDSCLVLPPTGVAADNIGGQTYHSIFPMPSKDIDRDDIMPKDKER